MAGLLDDFLSSLIGSKAYEPTGGGMDQGAPQWVPAQSVNALPGISALSQTSPAPTPQPLSSVTNPSPIGGGGNALATLFPHSIFARMAAQDKAQAFANQTARWLISKGVDGPAAAYLASNPTAMNQYLNQYFSGQGPDYKIATINDPKTGRAETAVVDLNSGKWTAVGGTKALSAPTVIESYDGQGRTVKMQWNPQTGQYEQLGGAKANTQVGTVNDPKTGMPETAVIDLNNNKWMPIGAPRTDVMSPGKFGQELQLRQAGRPLNVGSIPPGYQLQNGPNGAVSMSPIPGGPVAQKQAQQGQQTQQTTDLQLQDINRALNMSNGWTTGMWGAATQYVPGSQSYDLKEVLSGIGARITVDTLNKMRQASPTGGALGQVSNYEDKMMRDTMGSIEQSQSKQQFEYNLKRLHNIYLDTINGTPEQLDALVKAGKISPAQRSWALSQRYQLATPGTPMLSPGQSTTLNGVTIKRVQ